MTRCEYIERKTPSKDILEFLKHFSSRSHHKLYFGPPYTYKDLFISNKGRKIMYKNTKFMMNIKIKCRTNTFKFIHYINLLFQKDYRVNQIRYVSNLVQLRTLIHTVSENTIATIKMRNDFCYPLKMVMDFSLLLPI